MEKINIAVGYDAREAIAYHVFCQSVLEKSSMPVQFLPLCLGNFSRYEERHNDGSNAFIYTRFLTPLLFNFEGWAIFADGDMVCQTDIKILWDERDESKAVQVVKHNYQTKAAQKYLGNKNENYPRKNWSSLILWNCGHPANKILSSEFVQRQPGSYLHRFSWLEDSLIGELATEWNWLAIEYPENSNANIVHYTLGTPCFSDYRGTSMSEKWTATLARTLEGYE